MYLTTNKERFLRISPCAFKNLESTMILFMWNILSFGKKLECSPNQLAVLCMDLASTYMYTIHTFDIVNNITHFLMSYVYNYGIWLCLVNMLGILGFFEAQYFREHGTNKLPKFTKFCAWLSRTKASKWPLHRLTLDHCPFSSWRRPAISIYFLF